jgi:hypothetical protein
MKFYEEKTRSIYDRTQTEILKINQSRQKKEKQLTEF